MIPAELLGELKDRAAGLLALAELLSSRRVGPKAVAAALPSSREGCAGLAAAANALAPCVVSAASADADAAREIQSIYDRAIAAVQALDAALQSESRAPESARTRLVLERAAHAAGAHISAALFVAEMFAAASAPRPVSIHVADVLVSGAPISARPNTIQATLDAPPAPVATVDARLLRMLIEIGVQLVAEAGVQSPHVQVSATGASARVSIANRSTSAPPPSRRPPRSERPEATHLAVRRLPWSADAVKLVRAAAEMAGAALSVQAGGRGLTLVFS